jgi:hypothetical protein
MVKDTASSGDAIACPSMGYTSRSIPEAADKSKPNIERIVTIDLTRGCLILLMIVVHAATPCEPMIREAIQSSWPLYMATKGFVMLSGYAVAVLYERGTSLDDQSRSYRRCADIILVMLWTNVMFSLGKAFVNGDLASSLTVSWIVGLFTFQSPYGISGVLLPIALQRPLFPLMYKTELKWGAIVYPAWILGSVTVVAVGYAMDPTSEFSRYLKSLFILEGAGGFAVLPYISLGILGFVTGRFEKRVVRNMSMSNDALVVSVFLGISILIGAGLMALSKPSFHSILPPFLYEQCMFVGCVIVGNILASVLRYSVPNIIIKNTIVRLGQYALFVFVFHRVTEHVIVFLFGIKNAGYLGFGVLTLTIVAVMSVACFIRERHGCVNTALTLVRL